MSNNVIAAVYAGANVWLDLVSSDLEHGEWNITPNQNLPDYTWGQFVANGSQGIGHVQGVVIYQSSDGTLFPMGFNDPLVGDNSASISALGPHAAKYSVSCTGWTTHGDTIMPTYTVEFAGSEANPRPQRPDAPQSSKDAG